MTSWTPMTTPPPTDGRYLIHAPSADPDLPFIAIAWWNLPPWVKGSRTSAGAR